MRRAKESGIIISLNTNGICDRRTQQKIAEVFPAQVAVSIDGGQKVNDTIRGRGTFTKALQTMDFLHKQGIRVAVNSVLTKLSNLSDIEQLIAACEGSCEEISFFHGRPIGRGYFMQDQMLNFYSLHQINQEIEKLQSRYPSVILKTSSPTLKKNAIRKNPQHLLIGGSDGFTRFNIFPDGNTFVGGCTPYVTTTLNKELSVGNIREYQFSIDEIWHKSQSLWEKRKELSIYQLRCEGCEEYTLKCSGFTTEMEEYRRVRGYNPFCIK